MFSFEPARFIDFRDTAECERVRAIKKQDITRHPNPEFKIRVIEDRSTFYLEFALDLIRRIKQAGAAGESLVAILPVGPVAQYPVAARIINELNIDCRHLVTFAMDEYADQDGNTAPADWEGSFQRALMNAFFGRIRPELCPPVDHIHFPSTANLDRFEELIDRAGGADVCYGGVGWCGHIAFFESHLAREFPSLAEFSRAGPRLVELHPMTIMQNALHSFSGDWSRVPPYAATIGPAQVVSARDRSFWLDGADGGISWQRFIARLAAHGRPTPEVPASILQTVPGTYTILGAVADNVAVDLS